MQTDALGAAKLGHSHPDILEVDGPWFELVTGRIIRSVVHNCQCNYWEIIGFRDIMGSYLEIDVRSLTDRWSRLRLPIYWAVELFDNRSVSPWSNGCDISLMNLVNLARYCSTANNRALLAENLSKITHAGLIQVGALVTSHTERSTIAQAVRQIVIDTFQKLIDHLPDPSSLQKQLDILRAATEAWQAQYGSDPKPPRSARRRAKVATTETRSP